MEKLRVIVVDDEQSNIVNIRLFVALEFPELKIVGECNSAITAVELISDFKPDIVFMDINMPGINGIEVLEMLEWKDFFLVYITGHSEYALKAIKCNAFGYILKPINSSDLRETIDRILAKIDEQRNAEKLGLDHVVKYFASSERRIVFNTRNNIESVPVHNILVLESESNYTRVSLADGREISCSKALREFNAQLCIPLSSFMRVHSSFIVNLNQISRYIKKSEEIIMSNGLKVPLAKSRKERFYMWLMAQAS